MPRPAFAAIRYLVVGCQHLKRMGAKTAGCYLACYGFILSACVCGGGPGTLQSGHGRKNGSHRQGSKEMGGEWQHAELWLAHERSTSSLPTAAALALAHGHGENSKPDHKLWLEVKQASQLECAEPHSGSPEWQISFTAHWTSSLGPHGTGRGTKRRLNTSCQMRG
jgi:hypothetical protein